LKQDWQKWDANRDGLISLSEYQAFMRDLDARQNAGPRPGTKAPAVAEPVKRVIITEEAAPPLLYRAGAKLPPEVPSWFQQLDKDGDGQISLFEWKAAGRDLDEFVKMDRNDDCYLTVEEVLHYQRFVATAGKKDAGKTGG
jgi:hypothetical protein